MKDVLWLSEHHPDVLETLHAYLQWRGEQQKQANKKRR